MVHRWTHGRVLSYSPPEVTVEIVIAEKTVRFSEKGTHIREARIKL